MAETKKKVTLRARVTTAVAKEVEERAKRDRRTLSEMVRLLIEDQLAATRKSARAA